MSGNEELELRARETELDKRVADLDKKENRLNEIQEQLRKKIDAFNQEKEAYLKNQKNLKILGKIERCLKKSWIKKLKRAYGLMKKSKKN